MSRFNNGLVGLIFLTVGAIGGYVGRGDPVLEVASSDAHIKTSVFEASLTLSDSSLVRKYGEKDLQRLFESTIYDIYGEIETPELKPLFGVLRIKYLRDKISMLEMLSPENQNRDVKKITPEPNSQKKTF